MSPLFALVCGLAEAAEYGNVRGHVEDDSGIAVPGADVRLSGPAIAGELAATTDDDGNFRILNVPPGTHTLTVTKSGMAKSVRQVTVRLDETSFVPVTLQVGTGELVVQEVAPVIDTTRSSVSTEMSYDSLTNLPVGRSYQDVTNILPGVSGRVDTETGGPGTGNPSVRGEGQYGNNYLLDGISTRDPSTKTFGTDVNFDAIQDIQVYTDGAPAEFGEATGMLVNVVTKDGGDEHHGTGAIFFSRDLSFGTYQIADLSKHEEVPTEKRSFDDYSLSVTAGGPIVKEKLWYFAALDLGYGLTTYEGMDVDYTEKSGGGFAKLTWFATPDFTLRYQFNGQVTGIDNDQTNSQFQASAQSRYASDDLSHLLSAEWRPDARSQFELKALYSNSHVNSLPMSGDEDTPEIHDLDSGTYYNNFDSYDLNTRGRAGASLKYTRLFEHALGSHVAKIGLEGWDLTDSRELIYTGPDEGYTYLASAEAGRPCETADFSDCLGYTQYHDAGAIGHRGLVFAGFIQDDWQPVEPVTINVGARVDRELLYQNDGDLVIDQWMPAPRLGAAWDITRDNKTVLTVNAGRYYDVNGNAFADWGDSRSAYWYDQYEYDPEVGDYVLVYSQNPEQSPSVYCTDDSLAKYRDLLLSLGYTEDDADNEIAGAEKICNGRLRPYHMDKLVVGLEREILPLFAVGVRGIVSQTVDLPEDVDYNGSTYVIANPASKRRDYWAIELTAERKFDQHWQLLASYTYSQAKGTMPGQFELSSGGSIGSDGNEVGVYDDDVNDLDTRAGFFDSGLGWVLDGLAGLGTESDDAGYYGYLPYHSFHSVKINGSYSFPFGTTVGVVYEFDSGHAWQKRGYVELYQDYYAFPEGRGSRFMPPAHYLDLHVAHKLDFKKGRGLEASLDVFNVLDLDAPITYYENDDANFGLTLYRQEPRSIRASIKGTY